MTVSLGTFETLADAQTFQIREGNITLGTGVNILPVADMLCNGRLDCQGCARLAQGIQTNTHKVLFLQNDLTASFALCQRGVEPSQQRLLTIQYPFKKREMTARNIDLGSTQCPREHGEHATI